MFCKLAPAPRSPPVVPRAREFAGYRFGKPRQTVDACDQNISHTAVLQLGKDRQPEFRAFLFPDPEPEQFLVTFKVDAERQVHGTRLDQAVQAHLEMQRIEVDDRINRIQSSALPGLDVLEDRVRDVGNQRRRHLGPVQLFQMPLDFSSRHPASVKRQDLVVESLEPSLALPHELRIVRAGPISRDFDLDGPGLGMDRLFAFAIARVSGIPALGRVRFVPEVFGHLAFKSVLNQPLGQLLENPAIAENLFGALALDQFGEQLVGPISSLPSHDSLLSIGYMSWPVTRFDLHSL